MHFKPNLLLFSDIYFLVFVQFCSTESLLRPKNVMLMVIGNQHKHLNIYLCNHNQPTYSFELVVEANKKNFNEHLNYTSNYYSNLHTYSIYMINLCTDNKLANNFESGYPEMTPIHMHNI